MKREYTGTWRTATREFVEGEYLKHNRQLRDDLYYCAQASALGWVPQIDILDNGYTPQSGLSFVKGDTHVWYSGYRGSNYIAAELIDDRFCNHRAYPELISALCQFGDTMPYPKPEDVKFMHIRGVPLRK